MSSLSQFCSWLVENASFRIKFEDIIVLATIYALFGDDIKYLTTVVDADYGFFVGNCFCAGLFMLELLISAVSRTNIESIWPLKVKGYLASIPFFLDCVVIVSLLTPTISRATLFLPTDAKVLCIYITNSVLSCILLIFADFIIYLLMLHRLELSF